MRGHGWSLAQRMTRWFALSMVSLVLIVSGLSAWYLEFSIRRDLDARLCDKLAQVREQFTSSGHSFEEFEQIVGHLELEPYNARRMAWLVWDDDSGDEWGRFGTVDLLPADAVLPREIEITTFFDDGRCWRAEALFSDKLFGLLFDGSDQTRLLHSFVVTVLSLGAIAAVASVGCAAFFGRRVANLLQDVARSARSVRSTTDGKVSVDVSRAPQEIRDVADALSEMLANIERESDKARLIVAGLAHELRSPIQNLLGEAEVALLRQRSAEEYRAVLASNLEELRDLGRVVDNLVLLCASQDASRGRELEEFDLGREAELRLSKDGDRARQEGLELQLRQRGDLTLRGDREALLLALRNLVTNALKWSPAGGKVRVELSGEGDTIVLLVDDAGPGVPERLRERVFEPFFQGPALHGKRAGYGLGLALTRSAVVAHGGSIVIEDSPLGGARIRVVLPRPRRSQHQDVA